MANFPSSIFKNLITNMYLQPSHNQQADMISCRWASNDLNALRLGAVASKAEWNCENGQTRGFLPAGWSHIQAIYR